MATQSGVENPTRVEVVAALIYRCAVTTSKVSSGSLKPSVLRQISEIEFHALVGQLKAGLAHFCDTYGKNFTGQELIQLMFKEEAKSAHSNDNHHVNMYRCTSWCREGDGIEAFVTLEEQEMAVFERDEELLPFSL
ncbi:hypothetical protein AAG906_004192 [Vitis piasezkii]